MLLNSLIRSQFNVTRSVFKAALGFFKCFISLKPERLQIISVLSGKVENESEPEAETTNTDEAAELAADNTLELKVIKSSYSTALSLSDM